MTIRMSSAVIKDKGKILLLKRSNASKTMKGAWQFPEGKIGLNETKEEALVREINEETSLSVKSYNLLCNISNWNKILGVPVKVKRYIYLVKAIGDIKLSKEHVEYGWFKLEEATELPLHHGMREALIAIKNPR